MLTAHAAEGKDGNIVLTVNIEQEDLESQVFAFLKENGLKKEIIAHWIPSDRAYGFVICSHCRSEKSETFYEPGQMPKFCRECGATMVEDKNDGTY